MNAVLDVVLEQLPLVHAPIVGLMPIALQDANRCLDVWGHQLGPVWRPFRSEAFGLELDSRLISVAVSASTVSATVLKYRRGELVELARLCSHLDARWATRIMLRLWRQVCAPRWESWSVKAAVSYSHNAQHRGGIYRFDGWTKVKDDCGSSGGGTWTRKRTDQDAAMGKKTLWLWRYGT